MDKNIVTKYLFEVRFNPLPSFLDKRGSATEILLDNLFDTWKIDKNRIDLFSNSNSKVACFVSYRNFGLVSETENTKDFFIDKSEEFIKKVWNIITPDRYVRFGIRITEYIPTDTSFKKLVSLYRNSFLKLADSHFKSLDCKIKDVSFPLDFVDNKNSNIKLNLNTAPMQKPQAMQFFSDESLLADQGTFIDIDYFNDNAFSDIKKQKDYIKFLNTGIDKAEVVRSIIQDLLKNEDKQ